MPLATIIHLSDLHFGATFKAGPSHKALSYLKWGRYPHDPNAARQLALKVKELLRECAAQQTPAVVVHTGDITRCGGKNQFELGQKFLTEEFSDSGLGLKSHSQPLVAGEPPWAPRLFQIPGNHDAWKSHCAWYPPEFKNYPSEFVVMNGSIPVAILYGVDSNESLHKKWALSKGDVSSRQLRKLTDLIRQRKLPDLLQVVCIHHPLATNGKKADEKIRLMNRDEVSKAVYAAGAGLVLGGHIHEFRKLPDVNKLPINVIAGSGAQLTQDHNFLVYQIHSNRVEMERYDRVSGQFVGKPLAACLR